MEKLINIEQILLEKKLQQLFKKTFEHPELLGKIDFVCTKWLSELKNPTPTSYTDLGDWSNPNELVGLTQLYQNIEKYGMRDPFIIGAGTHTRKIRLESGNHRIHCMLEHDILIVPAVVYIGETSITYTGNGTHEGKTASLNLNETSGLLGPYSEKYYAKPSEIINGCPAYNFNGWK